MQTKNAIGNLINRYRSILKKCNLLNTFGTLAVAGMFIMGSAGVASAANTSYTATTAETTIDAATIAIIEAAGTGFVAAFTSSFGGDAVVKFESVFTGTGGLSIFASTGDLTLEIAEASSAAESVTISGTSVDAVGILNILAAGTFTSTAGSTVNSFGQLDIAGTHTGAVTLNATDAVLNLNGGTIAGAVTVTKGIFNANGGEITGALTVTEGEMTVEADSTTTLNELFTVGTTGVILLQAGEEGVTTLNADNSMTILGSTVTLNDRSELNVVGDLNISATGALIIGDIISDDSGATVNISTDLNALGDVTITHESTLNVTGTTTFSATTMINGELNATGAVAISKGLMTVNGTFVSTTDTILNAITGETSALVLAGTHKGDVTLIAADNSGAILTGADGIIDGNLTVTKGDVKVIAEKSLTVTGNMITADSVGLANGTAAVGNNPAVLTSLDIVGILDITAGTVTVGSDAILSTAGTTLTGAAGELALTGTHKGDITLAGNATVADVKITATGGTIDGDLIVDFGTVTLGTNNLTIKGDMTLAGADTDAKLSDLEASAVLTVGGNLTLNAAYTGVADTDIIVGKALTLVGDTNLTLAGSLTADTIIGTGDITVIAGSLSVNQDVDIVETAIDTAKMEVIFTSDSAGTVEANTVTIKETAGATRTAGHIIANALVIADAPTPVALLTLTGGTTGTELLTFKANKTSSDLGVDEITLTMGIVSLGEKGDNASITDNNATTGMKITLNADTADDATLNLNGGTFSIAELSATKAIIGTTTVANTDDKVVIGTLNVATMTTSSTMISGGTINATTLTNTGTLTVSGGTLNVTGAVAFGATTDILAISETGTVKLAGTVDLSTAGQININGTDATQVGTLDLGNESIAIANLVGAAADKSISIGAFGVLKTNALTLTGAAANNLNIAASTSTVIANTLTVNNTAAGDGTLTITKGTLQVNGNGSASSLVAAGIDINTTDSVLTLGKGGGSTAAAITGTAGTLNVNGTWTLSEIDSTATDIKVDGGKLTVSDDKGLEIATGALSVKDGSLNVTNAAGLVFSGAGTINLDKGSLTADLVTLNTRTLTLTNESTMTVGTFTAGTGAIGVNTESKFNVETLMLNVGTILTADASTITVTGKEATSFVNAADDSVVLTDGSLLVINENALLATVGEVDTKLATVFKIKATGDASTLKIAGKKKSLSIAEIKTLNTDFVSAGDVLIDAEGLVIADSDLAKGYVSSTIINNSSVDITGQTIDKYNTVYVANTTDSLTNFAADGLMVEATQAAVTAGEVVNVNTLKLVGNNIVTYIDTVTDPAAPTFIADKGNIKIADEGELILTGATAGKLDTVTINDTAATTLNIDGSYNITNITGTTAMVNAIVNVKGGDLDVTNLTKATVNAVGGDLEITKLNTVTIAATTDAANIEIDTVVQGGILTLGGTGIATPDEHDLTFVANEDSTAFEASNTAFGKNIVNSTIGKFAVATGTAATASTVVVGNGGMLAFGEETNGETVSSDWIATSMNNAGLVMGSGDGMIASAFGVVSALNISVDVTAGKLTDGQSIKVGTGATAAAAGDAGFGSDSLFVVNAGSIGTGTALTGTNIDVDKGAKLLITNVALSDGKATVAVAKGTAVTSTQGAWGFQDVEGAETLMFDNVFLKVAEGSLYNMTNVNIEIEQVLASDAFGPNLDSALGGLIDNAVGNNLTTKFVDDASHAGAAAVEGGAKLGTVAGIAPSLNAIGNAGLSNIQARNSISGTSTIAAINYSGDTLVAAADTTTMTNGIGVWAMPMYKTTNASDLESGNFKYGYDTNFFGISIGADYTFDLNADSAMRLGATFNTGTGTTDSTGDFAATTNDFSYFGVGIYGTYQIDNLGVTADFGYTSSSNDITQNTIGSNLTADPNASLMSFGVRGEYLVPTANVDVVPYLGLRWNSNTVEEYDSSFKGETAFGTNEQTASVIEIPLGISLRKEFEMDNDTTMVPKVELGVKFSFGDLDTTQEVTLPGVTGTASMDSTAMDAVTFQGGLGVAFNAGSAMSFDVDYKLEISSNVTNNGVFGTFRYNF